MSARQKVLVAIGALWPGNDSSGPNLSVRAMCQALADDFEFVVVACDRPPGGTMPLAAPGWHQMGSARIAYLQAGALGARGLRDAIRSEKPDVIMLNGFNDHVLTIPVLVLRRLGMIPPCRIILSPRGEFSSGARALSALRKRAYRTAAGMAGLLRAIVFHVTSDAERDDVAGVLPDSDIVLIPNMRPLFALPDSAARRRGAPLRVFFLGRISRVKGLDVALRALAKATVAVSFDIYGPISDADHWRDCQTLIAALPPHVTVTYHGEVANDDVGTVAAAHDLLLLPSRSENFGHAIFESLASGTPVMIGEETPWRRLAEREAGFDLPLADLGGVASAIDRFAHMDGGEAARWRQGARALAEDYVAGSPAVPMMRALLTRLASSAA